ncbi:MAG: PilZ domain-containing protein, partial [Methylocystis sp.]|nr:PilZ domain-containing protein [Methylocystis sp.]
ATAMSPNDVVLTASVKPALGEKVILYLSALGRFPGTVTRATEEGFELKLDISKRKRERLTDQLGWFAARLSGGVIERRRHERIVPLVQDTKIYVPDEHAAKIISISITGVGLEASVWPPVGAMVVVGNTPGIVVRHFDEGFACEFIQPFGYDEFDASIQP